MTCSAPGSGRFDERGGGAVSAPMAIAAIALLAAIGLGVDGVRHAQDLATADAVAEEAARAAGQAVDIAALRRGSAALDPVEATAVAQEYLTAADVTGRVVVLDTRRIRVETEITRATVLLGLLGIQEMSSTGAAEAVLVPVAADGVPS